ncbi:hypothetical protein F2Q68_00030568, partial [Brassica cretica]
MYYYCSICDFAIDLICVKKEVKKEIGDSKIHEHLLSLVPEMVSFTCHLCQVLDDRFPFVCNLCDLSFHQYCAESISEINYSCHPQHPLKRYTRVPSRTCGKCCLCGNKLHNVFYHCSVCNFSVDINCVKNPPPFSLLHPKAHEHPIILMPQRSFLCNACGMDDDPNPYVCPQCNFMIHRNCVDKPQVIKISHHDHRIYYNHYLDSDDWECGVCQKEMKWTCGAYSCLKCQDFAVHLRCATKFGIWDGIELEGISETNIELKSYEVVEEGLIKHSGHQNHVLKLKEESDGDDEGIVCEACVYPVFCGPFYSCTGCDNYILHQKCAHLPKKKIDSFYKMEITLFPCDKMETILGLCEVCQHFFQGFRYTTKDDITLDMRCGSISEPFFHESHPHHPLYIDFTGNKTFKKEIGDSKIHEHPLSLVPEMVSFTCHLCQVLDDRFPFVCNLCDLSFHQDCAESISEINYSCHPQHPLKRFTRVPNRTGENCCLCGNKLHNVFYHCSVCNFSVDINCVKNPPPFSLLQPKAHEHPIILMPQRSFVCNACGMDDDPNPYVCPQCNFMIHRNCVDKPQVIKINHHDHRIYYNHYLDSDDWECGVCQKEIKWTCGAYSCPKCQDFAVHLRCATKFGIWDGIELEGISETNIELKSYEVVEEGLIKHSSHQNHVLKLNEESDADVEGIVCEACVYPVFCGPFYSCTECDNYILHQKCAHLPKKKIDSFYKMDITLFPCDKMETILGLCEVCQHFFQGFRYITKDDITLDMRCGSISEPFFHESHPHHPLYIDFTGNKTCKACGDEATFILSCQECGYFLDIKCPFLPNKVKHKYDKNHFLFLCYGKNPSDQYLCEICEEELNSEKWFYRCDECCITFHIKCTLGDLISLKQIVDAEPIKLEVIRNIHMT